MLIYHELELDGAGGFAVFVWFDVRCPCFALYVDDNASWKQKHMSVIVNVAYRELSSIYSWVKSNKKWHKNGLTHWIITKLYSYSYKAVIVPNSA